MIVPPTRTRITSGFGERMGRSGRPTFHAGIDLLGSRGDPVTAVGDGRVVVVVPDSSRDARTGGYGNVVAIDHGDGWWTVYAHLERILVTLGEDVRAGRVIGEVGNSSNGKFRGMGPHLHFEVRDARAGAPFPGPYRRYNVDPKAWLIERGVRYDELGRYVG